MLFIKLAFKNLLGAGLRTWLNVFVLSFAFVLMVFYNGMIDGWQRQGRRDTKEWEIGQGQYWLPTYDKYDPYTVQDAHFSLSSEIQKDISEGNLTAILLSQATIYPQGRMLNVILKGIEPKQKILKLPTSKLSDTTTGIPIIIGKRMSETAKLQQGDKILLRWRDKNGTFDATEVTVADIFSADVPSIDNGQIYLSIENLRKMTSMENEASILVLSPKAKVKNYKDWIFKDDKTLLADFDKMIKSKSMSGTIISGLLLLIALLAIFDTQILSIFRRQKEIGTYIALGMTRSQVVGIFTIEGACNSILATIVGAIYGIPFFIWLDKVGINFGTQNADMGITISDKIFPYYSFSMLITSILVVIISAAIISYLPARRITKMNPTDAIKGKISS